MRETTFLRQQLTAGTISRRAFLARMTALGAAGLIATQMAALDRARRQGLVGHLCDNAPHGRRIRPSSS